MSDGSLRIAFDARWIRDDLSGIGRYSLGLIDRLADTSDHDFTLIGGDPDRIAQGAPAAAKRFDRVECPAPPLSPRSQFLLPRILRRARADVYHAPYLHAPLRPTRCAVAITVHDLIPLRFGHGLAKSKKVRYRFAWNAWCAAQYRRADAIVTVSDFSRAELIEHARLDPARVVRIYNGVSLDHEPNDISPDLFRSRFGIESRMISYIGRQDPYKNIDGLVRAFALLGEMISEHVTLIIAGRIDPRYPEAQRAARDLGLEDRIVFTDYIDEPLRFSLLRGSDVFIFPSKYEGFGLPPLEAFALGVPVVASRAASIPEVVGDAATLIDPDDHEAMAHAIAELLNDDSLRESRIAAGHERAQMFTWEKCAREHLMLYERMAPGRNARQ